MAIETLTQEIYKNLKNLIVSSQLLAGTPLLEQELAQKLNVSRTPIREALRILESEGLVEIEARHSARVARISIEDVRAAYEVREWLETRVAAKAASQIDNATQEKLKAAAKRMPSEPNTHEEAVEAESADIEFHDLIIEAASNPIAKRVINECRSVTNRAAYFVPPGRYSQSKKEHLAILQALADHDPDEADRLMREHIRAAANRRFGLDSPIGIGRDIAFKNLDSLELSREQIAK